MTDAARMKERFRSSKKWQEFRKYKREHDCMDYITHKKLLARWNLHHLDMHEENYTDISNPNNFVCLNSKTHDAVHFLYTYYRKDPEVLDRLKEVLDMMVELSNSDIPILPKEWYNPKDDIYEKLVNKRKNNQK